MANVGYISLHRKIRDCVLWEDKDPFDRRSAWIDLLLLANHSDKKIIFNGKAITIKEGQYLTSVRKLADNWHWSINRTQRYLGLLENENMIERKSDNHSTLITIVNYGFYQHKQYTDEHTENTQTDTDIDTQRDTQTDTQTEHTQIHGRTTNNNDNNDNNVNNDNKKNKESLDDLIEQNFESLWKLYPRKEGKSSVSKKTKKEIFKVGYDKMAKCIELFIADMKEQNRDLQYYPQGSTFFNTKYKDYLERLEEKEKRESEILEKQLEEDIEESDDDDGWEKLYDENTTFDWGNF